MAVWWVFYGSPAAKLNLTKFAMKPKQTLKERKKLTKQRKDGDVKHRQKQRKGERPGKNRLWEAITEWVVLRIISVIDRALQGKIEHEIVIHIQDRGMKVTCSNPGINKYQPYTQTFLNWTKEREIDLEGYKNIVRYLACPSKTKYTKAYRFLYNHNDSNWNMNRSWLVMLQLYEFNIDKQLTYI